ncbi:MAG TPA: PPK2 family polyphosphate kinase [Nocardioides sp.]|nr:PPK2 family polyphosphate kinase [Nocardioides sp.]
MPEHLTEKLRLPDGPFNLADYPTNTTPGFDDDKAAGEKALLDLGPELLDLQTQMFAHRGRPTARGVLLVLQGMDTSGKGGVLKHTVGLVDPVGVRITSFKAPTPEERSHDFLWRIERAVPELGYLGVFDRSHYEDVLIAKVRRLTDAAEIERRYGAINDFEQRLTDQGITVLKCMLHISPAEQKARLQARLEDPTKYWKYNPGDVDERQLWGEYAAAYQTALERTHTAAAPWHVVPSDKKWYRNLAIAHLLRRALDDLDLSWPAPDFDLEHELQRLAEDTIS